MFGKNPESFISNCYTKIGKFDGPDIMYMDEIHGSLIKQAEQIVPLIFLKYLKAKISYENDIRIEKYPYSRVAIREGIKKQI